MSQYNVRARLPIPGEVDESTWLSAIWSKYTFLLLLALAFAVDVVTPFLIWRRMIPGAARWISDAAVLAILVLVVVRMFVFDRIPTGFLLLVGLTLIWGAVATLEGQSPAATAWGWWRMFKYPMLALFAYLQPVWPDDFSEKLRRLCLLILQVNVVIQLWQYASGQTPGDNLAGLFGRHGVSPLLMFVMFTLCLALGRWLTSGKWDMLLWVLPLGALASGLGEMKLFPFAVVALGLVAFFIQMIEGGQVRRLILYVGLFSIIAPAFASFYNVVVAESRGTRRLEEYLDLDTLDEYLNRTYTRGGGKFYIGRGFALQLGWQNIQRDDVTFLFGMGLGARGESVSLGITGAGLQSSYYGLTSGTSLLVFMQEFGTLGLTVMAIVALWIVMTLWRDVRRYPESSGKPLRYGLMIFTFGWPLWLWYSQSWTFAVMMMLYWAALGYVLHLAQQEAAQRPLQAAFPQQAIRKSGE